MDKLSILSFGAGAIGTYIGGSLALQGHQVVFLERPDVARQVRKQGLCLRLEDGIHTIENPSLVDSIEAALEAGPYQVALFALKSFDTQSALEGITPFAAEMPPILTLQNGVENEAAIAAMLGAEKVISATVTSAIGRRGPGDIQLERLRGMGVGANHPLAQNLVEAFKEAGLNPRLYASAAEMKWSKMLTNLLANASSAILDMSPAQIFEHPKLYRVELAQLRETLKVMDAQKIQVVDLPGTPVRALSFAVRSLPASVSRPLLKNAVGAGRGGKMPSFHIDLYSGRKQSEVDYLNGAVVRYGEHLGIRTPVNRFMNDTLLALSNGDLPLDTYAKKPEKLLEKLGKAIE